MNRDIDSRPSKLTSFSILTAILIAVLGLWELLARAELISPLFFPAPTWIFHNMTELLTSGELWLNFRATLTRLLLGLFFGGSTGVLFGLVMGWSKKLRWIADPLVAALHPIPKISVLPLIMIIFGIGEVSKVIVVSVAVFFPILINTMAGVRHINPIYFEVAQNYGASFRKLFGHVVLPASLPMITTGVRIALNTSLVVTIAVELVSANEGLGAMIWLSWEILKVKDLYASLFFISLLGICSNLLLQWITRRMLPWYEPQ